MICVVHYVTINKWEFARISGKFPFTSGILLTATLLQKLPTDSIPLRSIESGRPLRQALSLKMKGTAFLRSYSHLQESLPADH
jgi:hypothetical protein